MAPVLDEIRQMYIGRAVVQVINLDDHPEAARDYSVRLIPTQVFFDAEGREVWRHEGFLSRDAIMERFRLMGIEPGDN
jgi:thioredoxin 1